MMQYLGNSYLFRAPASGIVTSGLTLYYDGPSYSGSGTVWSDLSGNGNTGTLVNGPSFNSANGGFFAFDGVDDEVYTTNQFSSPQAFSIGGMIRTSTASGRKIIGLESNRTGTTSGLFDRQIWIGTDGKLKFGIYAGGYSIASSPSAFNDGSWHYAIGTYGGEGNTMRLYVDESSVATATANSQNLASYAGYWRIGGTKLSGWPNGGDGYCTFSAGHLVSYNRGISAAEVSQNFSALRDRFGI